MILESLPWWEMAVRIVRKNDLHENYDLKRHEEIFYRLTKIIEKVLGWLDKVIPFFPSFLKTHIWKELTIYGLIMVPIIAIGIWGLVRTKHNAIKIGIILYLLWLIIPIRGLGQVTKKWLVDKTGLDYKIARSKQMVWIWTEDGNKQPYNLFEYRWKQRRETKSATILVSSLGSYRLIVNKEVVYDGPNFGSGSKVYYDEIDIDKYVKMGENNLEIIANFVEEEVHSHEKYPEPALLIGGWIEDGLGYHNLSDSNQWLAGEIKNIKNGDRISADAGFQTKIDFSNAMIETMMNKAKRLNIDKYSKQANPLLKLKYEEVKLKKDANWYDVGRFSTGYIEIEKKTGTECQLKLSWWEDNKESEYFNQIDEYQMPEGKIKWRSLNRRAGRYIKEDGDCGDMIEISFWRIKADLIEPKADEKLSEIDKQIYEMCLDTIENNVQNKIEDCVERERAMYVGDAREVSRCLMVDGNNGDYVKEMIRKMADSQRSNGAIPAMAPSGDDMLIPGYSLQWVVWLADYVNKSNDGKFAREMEDVIKRVMDWANKNEDEQSFMERKELDNWWNFTDWTPINEGYEISTGLQIWYYRALKSSEELYKDIDIKMSRYYGEKAKQLRSDLKRLAFDEEKGIFVDSFDENSKSMGTVVINGLAGISGLFDSQSENRKAIEYFRDSKWTTDSPYSQSWTVEWLIKADMKNEARQIIRQYWGEMIDRGATSVWEIFRPEKREESIGSKSHAWGCGPIYLYKMMDE